MKSKTMEKAIGNHSTIFQECMVIHTLKKKEFVKSYECLHPKITWHLKKKNALEKNINLLLSGQLEPFHHAKAIHPGCSIIGLVDDCSLLLVKCNQEQSVLLLGKEMPYKELVSVDLMGQNLESGSSHEHFNTPQYTKSKFKKKIKREIERLK